MPNAVASVLRPPAAGPVAFAQHPADQPVHDHRVCADRPRQQRSPDAALHRRVDRPLVRPVMSGRSRRVEEVAANPLRGQHRHHPQQFPGHTRGILVLGRLDRQQQRRRGGLPDSPARRPGRAPRPPEPGQPLQVPRVGQPLTARWSPPPAPTPPADHPAPRPPPRRRPRRQLSVRSRR